jgi:aminoglycoside phosphotransferase (APT) family kinase protein
MEKSYAEHLATLHGRFEAPPALIAAATRVVTTSPIVERERIVHGEANEVYRIAFASGLEVILRIARWVESVFEKEAWAIGRCRALGVCAPEVLSVQRVETEAGEALELCFLEKLPGARLSDGLHLPRETLRRIVSELGEQISRMHSIGEAGLGEAARFFAGDTDDTVATTPEFVAAAAEAGLDPAAVARGMAWYDAITRAAGPLPRVLTHNDFRACHVLTHEGHLSGLIDFGQVSLDSAINEFGKWAYWEVPELPVEWLQEGYGDKRLFEGRYLELFAAYRLANALWALRYYVSTGYAAGATRAAGRVRGYLAQLGLA